jgi:signal transduction histidine kinase
MELGNLVDDLLRVSAIDAGRRARKVETLDLSRLAREAVELFRPLAEARRIELRLTLPEAPLTVPGDRSDLELVLTNLISNAVKYNRDGGWVEVSASPKDGGVAVEVADGGLGIPEQQQAGLFQEFYRVKTPETARVTGTGLGLSIVKRLVQAHHGRVSVRSKYGQGSTFGFWLPEAPGPGDSTAMRRTDTTGTPGE